MTRLKLSPIDELYALLCIEGYKPVREFVFDDTRRWRFDLAVVEQREDGSFNRVGIEYDGLISAKSRHTTIGGFMEDCRKLNRAALLGWRVLRFTAQDFGNDGYALSTVLAMLRGEY